MSEIYIQENDKPLNYFNFKKENKKDEEDDYNENKLLEQEKTIQNLMSNNERLLNTLENQDIKNDKMHKNMMKELNLLNKNKLVNPENYKKVKDESDNDYSITSSSDSYNYESKYQPIPYSKRSHTKSKPSVNNNNNKMFEIMLMINMLNRNNSDKKSNSNPTNIIEKQNELLKEKIKEKEVRLNKKAELNYKSNPIINKLKGLEKKVKGLYNIKKQYNVKLNKLNNYQNKMVKKLKGYANQNLQNNYYDMKNKIKPPPIYIPFPVRE